MIKRKFTIIMHELKESLELSFLEYVLMDLVFWLQQKTGQCYCSRTSMAATLQVSRRCVFDAIDRLTERGLLRKAPDGKLRTCDRWIEYFVDYPPTEIYGDEDAGGEESAPVQKLHQAGAETAPLPVQKLHSTGEETAPKEYKRSKSKRKREEIQDPLALQILNYFNERRRVALDKRVDFRTIPKCVTARIRKDKITFEDAVLVIDYRIETWGGDPKMEQFITPDTLFADGNFQKYLVLAREGVTQIYKEHYRQYVNKWIKDHSNMSDAERQAAHIPTFEEWNNERIQAISK